jgi:hypothetical protein
MRTFRLMAVAVSSLSLAAAAQESTSTEAEEVVVPTPEVSTPEESANAGAFTVEDENTRRNREALSRPRADEPNMIKRIGLAVDVGGGVHDFVDRGHSSLVDTGGAWAARLTVGTRRHIGGELAYVGTANPISNTLGEADRAVLVSNGVEGLLRVNMLVNDWQPYAVGGYTYRRYVVQNSAANTSAIADGTNSSELPVGVGLAYRKYRFVGDLRAMVHPSVSSQLLATSSGLPTAVSVEGKVGFEF